MKKTPPSPRAIAPQRTLTEGETEIEAAVASLLSRRSFLQRGAGLSLAGLVPLLSSCGGGDDDAPAPPPPPRPAPTVARTLFFDLSAEEHAGKTYYLHGGGQTLQLTPVAQKPTVLAGERATNRFLSAVPDQNITHHVEAVPIATDSVTLSYVSTDISTADGTWSMSSLFFLIPPAATRVAFQRAQASSSGSTTPSALRAKYGMAAAQTEDEMVEESALIDQTTHAATLIGLHPDLMGLEPTAAATVQQNHVQTSIDARLLTTKIASLGVAVPQSTPGTPNATGWASLKPLYDDNGQPVRKKYAPNIGRLQYHTVLHPDVAALVGKGAVAVTPAVKNDASLGADITTLQSPQSYSGALWYRRDGRPNVDQSPGTGLQVDDSITFALKHLWPDSGLDLSTSTTKNADGTITVTVSFTNWYLRYLAGYVQFLDVGLNPIPLANIPEYTNKTLFDAGVGHKYRSGDNADGASPDNVDSAWLGLIPAINTIMGIPIETEGGAGSLTASFTLPKSASTVRFLSGGLGVGSNSYPETTSNGIGMTSFFCYGITALCASAGAGTKYPVIIQDLAKTLGDVANSLAAFIVDKASGADTSQFWSDQAEALVETILGNGLPNVLSTMVGIVIGIITESMVEDAIPIIGVVSQVISAAIGAADIILTTVDIATSPWTYRSDMTFTYDLSVSLTPDANNATFPPGATAYTVTAMIDNGTPFTQTLPITSDAPASLPPVAFKGIPLNGTLNVSVSFQQSATVATASDILLGKGSTGAVDNDGTAKALQITEIEFPIDATTTYKHQQKTFLDDNDQHVWANAPAPATNIGNQTCGGEGTICGYRNITVRQGTQANAGYVGYAWHGQNTANAAPPGCTTVAGPLDQAANLNTGGSAQAGYAGNGCGVAVGGMQVAYSLLSHGPSNYFLDTTDATTPTVRQISLDGTPQFNPPGQDPNDPGASAWGVLNMASDRMLLHPAGHLISLSSTNHKIETHQLPRTPLSDSDARVKLRALPKSGKGNRPGLLNTPVTAAVTAHGHLIVLEAGNNRLHALDLGANPVALFPKQSGAPYFLQLDQYPADQHWNHLDIAVEFTGFIYVLSYNQSTFEYVMHIYHPSQATTAPISITSGFNAARLTVDFWRRVYAMNYEVIPRLNPANGTPPPLVEPSISAWSPCAAGHAC